jgi:hypothetical protein
VTKRDEQGEGEDPAMIAEDRHSAQIAGESEAALRSEGQRTVSAMWESTQMRLALMAVGGFMAAHIIIILAVGWVLATNWQLLAENPGTLTPLMVILTAALGALASLAAGVSATYFVRTNTHRVGGPGGDDAGSRR